VQCTFSMAICDVRPTILFFARRSLYRAYNMIANPMAVCRELKELCTTLWKVS
jgi:hypothetical protein